MKALGFIGFRVDDRMIHGIVATQWKFKSNTCDGY